MRKRSLIAGVLLGMVLCASTVCAETIFDEKEVEILGLQKEYTIAVHGTAVLHSLASHSK